MGLQAGAELAATRKRPGPSTRSLAAILPAALLRRMIGW